MQGALVGLVVSVLVQIWIFFGAQVLRNEMRSFRLPTRIDGCIGLNGSLTASFNTTAYSSLWANSTAMTTAFMKTAIKFVEPPPGMKVASDDPPSLVA
jgi:hypothetical protein